MLVSDAVKKLLREERERVDVFVREARPCFATEWWNEQCIIAGHEIEVGPGSTFYRTWVEEDMHMMTTLPGYYSDLGWLRKDILWLLGHLQSGLPCIVRAKPVDFSHIPGLWVVGDLWAKKGVKAFMGHPELERCI